MYTVYIKLDNKNNLRAIDSSALLGDVTGWIPIDEGDTSRHMHAQTEYLPGHLIDDERGIKRYKIAIDPQEEDGHFHTYELDGVTYGIYERTQEEMDADYVPYVKQPDAKDIEIAELKEQVAALSAAMLNM